MREKETEDYNMADSGDIEQDNGGVYSGISDQAAEEISRLLSETDISDMPATLIITNVDVSVFDNDNAKAEFEKAFMVYDENATFQYFKSFRRSRVNYTAPLFAANARIDLNEAEICGQQIKCFFFDPITMNRDNDDPHLQLPPPHKQFLISPPASPPVDWEQSREARPVINYDLLAAIAQLAPGEAHELHPPSEDQPGIVVHICEDPEGYGAIDRPSIVQTRCPSREK